MGVCLHCSTTTLQDQNGKEISYAYTDEDKFKILSRDYDANEISDGADETDAEIAAQEAEELEEEEVVRRLQKKKAKNFYSTIQGSW